MKFIQVRPALKAFIELEMDKINEENPFISTEYKKGVPFKLALKESKEGNEMQAKPPVCMFFDEIEHKGRKIYFCM